LQPHAAVRLFGTIHEAPGNPRERALAASVNAVLAQGRRGFLICGNGHLMKDLRPGNAREYIEKEHPGKFFLALTPIVTGSSEIPLQSVVTRGEGDEKAWLNLGTADAITDVYPSPLVFRDKSYWKAINLLRDQPIDLADPAYEYRGRYFEKPWPAILRDVSANQSN